MKINIEENIKKGKLIPLEEVDKMLFTKKELKEIEKSYQKRKKIWGEEARKEIAEDIRKARLKAGYTQAELAKLLKISRTNVVSLESGERNLTIESLNKVARAVGKQLEVSFV